MEDVTMSIFDLMGCAEDTGSLSNFLVKQKVVEVFQVNYKTLPKAQRTRGLSSYYKFIVHSTQILIELQFQNID